MRGRVQLACWSAAVLLSIAAVPVRAQEGVNLSWGDCGAFGESAQSFICNTNSGTVYRLFGSARSATPMPNIVQWISTLVVQADDTTLPLWWQFPSGSCRENSLSYTVHPSAVPSSCVDWEADTALDYMIYEVGYGAPNLARIRVYGYGNPNDPVAFPAGAEGYLFSLGLNRAKTVGAGACAGCDVPVCVTLQKVEFTYGSFSPGSATTRVLGSPLNSNVVSWNDKGTGCAIAVKSRRAVWGSLKSLYR